MVITLLVARDRLVCKDVFIIMTYFVIVVLWTIGTVWCRYNAAQRNMTIILLIHHCSDWGRIWIRVWTHKRHHIHGPNARAMGHLLLEYWATKRATKVAVTHTVGRVPASRSHKTSIYYICTWWSSCSCVCPGHRKKSCQYEACHCVALLHNS